MRKLAPSAQFTALGYHRHEVADTKSTRCKGLLLLLAQEPRNWWWRDAVGRSEIDRRLKG